MTAPKALPRKAWNCSVHGEFFADAPVAGLPACPRSTHARAYHVSDLGWKTSDGGYTTIEPKAVKTDGR